LEVQWDGSDLAALVVDWSSRPLVCPREIDWP
jgi:hypothetical protein